MRGVNGLALIVIGLVHSLALIRPGIVGFEGVWSEIARAGYVNSVSIEAPRIWGYYWFLMPGFALIVLGIVCAWVERTLNRTLPARAGWALLGFAAFGIALDTNTGFWLVLAVAVNIVVASLREPAPPAP